MLNNKSLIVAICAGVFWYVGNSQAQISTPDISQIKYLYEELRFENAVKIGQHLLTLDNDLSRQHLAYIHQYMAYSYYNIGITDSARVHFLSLLSINPGMELNPLETSPKIIDFYNQIKKQFHEVDSNPKILSYPKYIFMEDKRPDAAWRSAILPGWGQYYKGQSTRAYIFGGAFITSAIILGTAIINENKYKDSYLSSSDPDEISINYNKYNNWSKVRRVSTFTTIGIWLLSFADALWSDYPKVRVDSLLTGENSIALFYSFSL